MSRKVGTVCPTSSRQMTGRPFWIGRKSENTSGHPLVTFGSHTVDHIRLGLSSDDEVRRQIQPSKSAIQGHTGKECSYFCFPSGSFSLRSLAILQEVGYSAAVTTLEGLNPAGSNMLALRRVSPPMSDRRSEILWHLTQLSKVKQAFRFQSGHEAAECLSGD